MKKIIDIDEKRLQLGYFLSRHKGDNTKFCMANMYRQWCQWWKEDFLINDIFQLELYDDRLVLSMRGAKLGETQPDYMEYYNNVLLDVQKYLSDKYDNKASTRVNSDRFREKLLLERKKNFKRLKNELQYRHLDKKYYVVNKTDDKHPCKLGRYVLHDKSASKHECCCIGTYETVLNYIKGLKKGGKQNVK